MSEWQNLFQELRRLYGNVSELLIDAERLLDAAGYVTAHGKGKRIGIERSGDIHQPDSWAPQWVARFFWHNKRQVWDAPILFVACILSDGGAMDYKLPGNGEPVVTAGILRYRADVGDMVDWAYWNAKYWAFADHPEWPAMEWKTVRSEKLAGYHIDQLETFAVPLVRLQKRLDLDTLVIKPLLAKAGIQASIGAIEETEAEG